MQLARRTLLVAAAVALAACAASPSEAEAPARRILLLAGPPSHGYGAHEHLAGCQLMADRLERLGCVEAAVTIGWPEDERAFDGVDALVVFGNGGAQNPLAGHFEALQPLLERGMGLGLLHYALIVDDERHERKLIDWIGGVYELDWSVNPHWTASISSLPAHAITRGVAPFVIEDEWYYHMRFQPGMTGVQPLLTALPSASSLERPDGPHSGNPAVREAVLVERRPQHLAWCTERAGGGRGFGFTGLHWHWNWAHDGFRTLLLNACLWLARAEVPGAGVASQRPSIDELIELAGEPPHGWRRESAQRMIDRWRQPPESAPREP
ncbi:MAG: ThuA domain-containing protein [bacterium]|nr:ThuA domain-containing protein [bacterium]